MMLIIVTVQHMAHSHIVHVDGWVDLLLVTSCDFQTKDITEIFVNNTGHKILYDYKIAI